MWQKKHWIWSTVSQEEWAHQLELRHTLTMTLQEAQVASKTMHITCKSVCSNYCFKNQHYWQWKMATLNGIGKKIAGNTYREHIYSISSATPLITDLLLPRHCQNSLLVVNTKFSTKIFHESRKRSALNHKIKLIPKQMTLVP